MTTSPFHQKVADETPALRRYARSLTRDHTAADDLVQDTLVLALQRQATFREGSGLRSWLLSILHNRFVSDRRAARAMLLRHEHVARETLARVEVTQEDALRLAWLDRAFGKLSEEQRATLHLVAVDGFSYSDAAALLGVPVGTIMSRLSRARAALRDAERLPVSAAHPARLRLVGGRDE